MKMGGFMGEITYEGELKEFWPYIRLGEYVHVGKGSGFGLGRYRIEAGQTHERCNKNSRLSTTLK